MNTIIVNIPDSDYSIEINLWGVPNHMNGEITSNIKTKETDPDFEEDKDFNNSIDAIESLVLALACSGVDVTTEEFKNGLYTAIDACAQHC